MTHPLPARTAVSQSERPTALHLLCVTVVALAVRLLLLPLASQDTNDHTGRIFIAWRWAEDPFLFLHGRWPTLHFYLVGPVIRLFDDQILAPVLLHVVIGSLIPAALYLFTAREFGRRSAALAVGLAFALYPIAIRTSLEVLAQAPFSLCLALTLLGLSRARDVSATWAHAAAAGVAATLTTMLRVEGWLLLPFLALTLWGRWRLATVFVAVAMIGPLVTMVANTAHYDDPLHQLNAAAGYELEAMAKEDIPLAQRLLRPIGLVVGLIAGMTPVLALLAGLGALFSLVRVQRQAVWLIPLGGLSLLLFAAAIRGSLVLKPIYTETLGLLLIPFLAAFLVSPPVRRLGTPATAGIHGILFGSMAFLLVIGTLRDIPGMRERSRLIAAIPALGPVPTLPDREVLDRLLAAIRAQDGPGEPGLVIDYLGNPHSFYLGLHSLFHPSQIFIAPVTLVADLDARLPPRERPLRERWQPLRDSDLPDLDDFLRLHRTGVVVLQPGSRLAAWMDYRQGRASVRGVPLVLEELARIPWPLPGDARLRAPGVADDAPGEAIAFRYTVTD